MQARHRLSQVRMPMLAGAGTTWLPVLVGIGLMAGFMIYGITSRAAGDRPEFDTPVGGAIEDGLPTLPGTPASGVTEGPTDPPPTEPPVTVPPPTEHPPPPPHPSPPQPPPPQSDVVGSYRVEDSFPHEFTGRVLITNTSGHARGWTVQLAFPPNVGELREFWVDGTTQPTVRRDGDRYTFTSGAPVGAGAYVVLKVQFDRSGGDVDPVVCTVDGTPCTIA